MTLFSRLLYSRRSCKPSFSVPYLQGRRLVYDKGVMNMNYQIIAVDLDGTLCFSNWPELGEPNKPLIEYLKGWRAQGNKLILWTSRAGEALDKAVTWCKEQHLEFDAVNDNLPEVVEMYGNNSRKITCDFYTDDKAMLPGMVQAYPVRVTPLLFCAIISL